MQSIKVQAGTPRCTSKCPACIQALHCESEAWEDIPAWRGKRDSPTPSHPTSSSNRDRSPASSSIPLGWGGSIPGAYFSISSAATFRFSYSLSLRARTMLGVSGAKSFSGFMVTGGAGRSSPGAGNSAAQRRTRWCRGQGRRRLRAARGVGSWTSAFQVCLVLTPRAATRRLALEPRPGPRLRAPVSNGSRDPLPPGACRAQGAAAMLLRSCDSAATSAFRCGVSPFRWTRPL